MESLKHRYAKNTVAKWFRDATDEDVERLWLGIDRRKGSRGVYVEYPICIDLQGRLIGADSHELWDSVTAFDFRVPTYQECIDAELLPVAIFDVAIADELGLSTAIEIVHRHDVSEIKESYIRRMLRENPWCARVWSVDADWVLSQSSLPSQMEYLRKWVPVDETLDEAMFG